MRALQTLDADFISSGIMIEDLYYKTALITNVVEVLYFIL